MKQPQNAPWKGQGTDTIPQAPAWLRRSCVLKGLESASSCPGRCGILDPLQPGVSPGLLGQCGLEVAEDRGHSEAECPGEQTKELKPVGNPLLQGREREKGPPGSGEGAALLAQMRSGLGRGLGRDILLFWNSVSRWEISGIGLEVV